MKTEFALTGIIKSIGKLIIKITSSIVKGIPSQKVYIKPNVKSKILPRNVDIKPSTEKHYHQPVSKPVVEKQTLLKEKKKVKTHL